MSLRRAVLCLTLTLAVTACRGPSDDEPDADADAASQCDDGEVFCANGVTESGETVGECAHLQRSCYHCGSCGRECNGCGPGFHPVEENPQQCIDGECVGYF